MFRKEFTDFHGLFNYLMKCFDFHSLHNVPMKLYDSHDVYDSRIEFNEFLYFHNYQMEL